MGGSTTGDHPDKISGRNRIRGCPANTFAGILPFDAAFRKGQPAGAHAAVFAANPLGADIAWFYRHRPIKGRFDAEFVCTLNHLLTGWIDSDRHWISQFLSLDLLVSFFDCHCLLLNLGVFEGVLNFMDEKQKTSTRMQ
jgi:hypothetical protein